MEQLKTLKAQVGSVLEEYPETRDSDITLMIRIWIAYHEKEIITFQNGTKYVALRSLYELPREDNIKRIRAKIQNEEGKYLPTKLEIALKRGILESKWREFMGYAPKAEPNQPNQEPQTDKQESNLTILCRRCGGGMRRDHHYDIETRKTSEKIYCVECGDTL